MQICKSIACIAISVLVAGTAGSAEVDISKLPPPATKDGVTYAKDIHPIFEASCFRCHGPEKPKGRLRLDSLEGVLKGGEEGKVITPGNSAKSVLVHAISQLDPEMSMPPKPKPGKRGPGGQGNADPAGKAKGPDAGPPPKPLTPEQVGLVRAWIDQGAK